MDLGAVTGSTEDMIKIQTDPKKLDTLSKSNVLKFSEEKMQNAILKRCDQAQMWQNIRLRKISAKTTSAMVDHKLNKSQPDAKSTQAKSHALKERGSVIVNVLAYHEISVA